MTANTNPFASTTDSYSNYVKNGDTATYSKNALQIKSLFSIVSHLHNFDLLGNVFTSCSGTKGLIYLDILHRTGTNRVLIAHNKFTQNSGYIGSNVLHLRARGQSSIKVAEKIPSLGNMFCTGYHLQANVFK